MCAQYFQYLEHQKSNRKKFNNYFQIFLKTQLSKVKKRNNKNIYSKKNVVGHTINFPKPYKNDLIINNNFFPYKKKLIDGIIKKIKDAERNKK